MDSLVGRRLFLLIFVFATTEMEPDLPGADGFPKQSVSSCTVVTTRRESNVSKCNNSSISNKIRKIINSGLDINVEGDFCKETCLILIHAVQNGCIRDVKLLISHKADLNVRDQAGRTALMWAIRKYHKDIATLLVEKGADLNVKDKNGWSALIWAILFSDCERNYTDIIELLIEK